MTDFIDALRAGIPSDLPDMPGTDPSVDRAPKRSAPLSPSERGLALRNALRYFGPERHAELAPEFAAELADHGHIYMHRFRPTYPMHMRPPAAYGAQSVQAASVLGMIQNNLDPRIAQHPYELVTYGGNGSVFQNWAQYLLTVEYLTQMSEEQTLVLYSGHPLGLFPSSPDSPRVVLTNGMVIPEYTTLQEFDKFNALGVTQYGQMTAGSFMYIGPQGIVHGTTITLLNAGRCIWGPATKGWAAPCL